nr:hypothetical protein [uncultured Roseateles sp.]
MYKPYATPSGPGDAPGGPALRPLCPLCKGHVQRIPRRLVDRLMSLFSPVQRFRCQTARCRWLGNLPGRDREGDQPDDGRNFII